MPGEERFPGKRRYFWFSRKEVRDEKGSDLENFSFDMGVLPPLSLRCLYLGMGLSC